MTVGELLAAAVPWLLYACALFAIRLWWRQRARPALWLTASFASIGLLLLIGELVDDPQGLVLRVIIVPFVAFPYLLARFADSITTFSRPVRVYTHAVAAIALVAMQAIDLSTVSENPQGPAARTLLLVLGIEWLSLLGIASVSLFRHRRGRSTVVKRRLGVMAMGSLLMGLALVPGLAPGSDEEVSEENDNEADPNAPETIASNGLAASSAILFLLGFAPPKALRASWRREDEEQLYNAAVSFMAADDAGDVTGELAPRLKDVLGSPGVAIMVDGEVFARAGAFVEQGMQDVREMPMGQHTLLVKTDPSMPLLNEGDTEFVARFGVLADLAMERARLMQAEKEARGDLEAVNAELESFVYTTSHDLKNPIIAMLGYIDLLKTEYAENLPAEAQRFIDRMQANAAYMEALIRDLLELSRVGRVDVEPDLVDIGSLVDGVTADVTSRFPSVTVEHGELPELWMNPTRARQLFGNLIENSAKYGGEGVAITVEAEPLEDGSWRFVVADDGKGIPEEYLERIFGVFERLESNKDGGTGMGLAICRRIVEQIEGHIRAVRTDVGARFEIDLPATAVPTTPLLDQSQEGVLQ